MNRLLVYLSTVLLLAGLAGRAAAHCEVPCGIYDDGLRFKQLAEHISTIEKALQEINKLSKARKPDYNQLVRWVTNKEHHAEAFQHIVSQYFLHQRIKPVEKNNPAYPKYLRQLELAHRLLVAAMKAKQSTALDNVARLRALLAEFEQAYRGK